MFVVRDDVILPKFIYNRFNAMPIYVPAGFFAEINKLILKFLCKSEKLRIPKTALERKKKEQNWKTHFPVSKFTT